MLDWTRVQPVVARLLAAIGLVSVAAGPAPAQDAPPAERPAFRPMRYDENWRVLADEAK